MATSGIIGDNEMWKILKLKKIFKSFQNRNVATTTKVTTTTTTTTTTPTPIDMNRPSFGKI